MLMKDNWIKRIKFISKKINIIAIYECKDEQVVNICDYWVPFSVYTFFVYKKIKRIFDAVCFICRDNQYIIFRLGYKKDWRKDVYFLGTLDYSKMLWYSFLYDRLKDEFYCFERSVYISGDKKDSEN